MPDEQDESPRGDVAPGAATPVPDEPAAPDEVTAPAEATTPVVPDEETLARIATPAIARRAPKFGAFIGIEALLGFVVGVVLAIALDRGDLVRAGENGGVLPFLGGSNGARLVTGLAFAAFGVLVGSLLALWVDARSRRHTG